MQKKVASLTAAVLLGMFIIFSFCPMVYRKIYWKNDEVLRGVASKAWERGVSMFERYPVFGIIIVLLVLVAIAALVLHSVNSRASFVKAASYAPIPALLVFVVLTLIVCLNNVPQGEVIYGKTWGAYGYYAYKPFAGFYVMCVCLFSASVLSVLLALNKFPDEPLPQTLDQPVVYYVPVQQVPAQQPTTMQQPAAVQPTVQPTTAPETNLPSDAAFEIIKKYKDLLDNDIITQEEFESKRKELLKL